jgi:hypothetical protein
MVDLQRAVFITLRGGALTAAIMLMIGLFTSPSLLLAGAVILMITPLARVLIAGICLLMGREYVYFAMATYILLILVITIIVRL